MMVSHKWIFCLFVCSLWVSRAQCAITISSKKDTLSDKSNDENFSQCSSFHYEEHVLKSIVEMKHQIDLLNDAMKSFEIDWKNEISESQQNMENKFESERKRVEGLLTKYSDFIEKRNPTTAFAAYISSSLTISNYDVLKFNQIWINVGNAYDKYSGIFRAKHAGLYHFSAVLMSGNGQLCYFSIWLNDEAKQGSYTNGDGHKTGTIDIVLNLKVGDRVYIKSKSSTVNIYSDGAHYTTFSGFLI